MKNQITILVPLWDRSEYTLDWIKNNYCSDYNYSKTKISNLDFKFENNGAKFLLFNYN